MAVLPPIQLSADAKMILVGNFGHFRLRGLPTLSSQDAKIVAGELGVPTGLVIRVANLSGGNPDRRADEIVGLLRVAVIDFRFLLAELTSYQPGTDGEPAKRAALSDLLEGNLPSVWCFYRELPWPEPPSGLRVVGSR